MKRLGLFPLALILCAAVASAAFPFSFWQAPPAGAPANQTPIRTNLVLELIGDNAPTGSVADWQDTGGGHNDVIDATTAAQPTKVSGVLNGHAVVRFDGVDDVLACASLTLFQPDTIIAVWRTHGSGSLVDGTASRQAVWRGDTDHLSIYAGGGVLAGSHILTDDVWQVTSCVFNAASSEAWMDGALEISGNPGSNSLSGLLVGQIIQLNGDIAEILIYSAALSDSDRQTVERYLGTKYGITVAAHSSPNRTRFLASSSRDRRRGSLLTSPSLAAWLSPLR